MYLVCGFSGNVFFSYVMPDGIPYYKNRKVTHIFLKNFSFCVYNLILKVSGVRYDRRMLAVKLLVWVVYLGYLNDFGINDFKE